MKKINNDSLSEKDIDFLEFDEYDIISGNDLLDSNEARIKKSVDTTDNSYQNVTPVDVYFEEWNHLFYKDVNLDELKKKALLGELRANHFRSLCWRCMLGILHNEPSQWLFELKTYRSHYKELWVELQQNPWNVEKLTPLDNPLSQEAESIWQKYFSNEELKAVIHQDVVRTFPGVEFFKEKTIQNLMVRILFCYARQNPSLCYRQGMHEILAPLIFILHCDHQALLHVIKEDFPTQDIFEILDAKYIEEDAYCLFKHVMSHIESSYRIKNLITTSTGYFQLQALDNKDCENEVINRLEHIKDSILKTSDPDLHRHLDELDISLHLFGIRWLRLLFGREFPFQDLLVLWDAIFASTNFELVNYIVVAMLAAIRHILLVGDYTTCLTHLMRYPSGVDVMFVIQYSLHLMDPSHYPVPIVTSFSDQPITLISKSKHKNKIKQNSDCNDSLLANNERLKLVPLRSGSTLSAKSLSSISESAGKGSGTIIKAFEADDPKVLKSELEYLSSVVGIVQTKLLQYYNILNDHLNEVANPEIKLALDGLYELYYFLKTHPNQRTNVDVETAFEVGESKQFLSHDKKRNSVKKVLTILNIADAKAHTLPKTVKKLSSEELKVFKQYQGGSITGIPMRDPLRLMRTKSHKGNNDKTNLEN